MSKLWGICPSLWDGRSGFVLRGKCLGEWTLLFFHDEAEAREMQRYLRSGLSVDESRKKQYARIDAEAACRP